MDKEILEELFELRKFKETIESDGVVVYINGWINTTTYYSKSQALKNLANEVEVLDTNIRELQEEIKGCKEKTKKEISKMSLFEFWKFKRKYKDDRESPINFK